MKLYHWFQKKRRDIEFFEKVRVQKQVEPMKLTPAIAPQTVTSESNSVVSDLVTTGSHTSESATNLFRYQFIHRDDVLFDSEDNSRVNAIHDRLTNETDSGDFYNVNNDICTWNDSQVTELPEQISSPLKKE